MDRLVDTPSWRSSSATNAFFGQSNNHCQRSTPIRTGHQSYEWDPTHRMGELAPFEGLCRSKPWPEMLGAAGE